MQQESHQPGSEGVPDNILPGKQDVQHEARPLPQQPAHKSGKAEQANQPQIEPDLKKEIVGVIVKDVAGIGGVKRIVGGTRSIQKVGEEKGGAPPEIASAPSLRAPSQPAQNPMNGPNENAK